MYTSAMHTFSLEEKDVPVVVSHSRGETMGPSVSLSDSGSVADTPPRRGFSIYFLPVRNHLNAIQNLFFQLRVLCGGKAMNGLYLLHLGSEQVIAIADALRFASDKLEGAVLLRSAAITLLAQMPDEEETDVEVS